MRKLRFVVAAVFAVSLVAAAQMTPAPAYQPKFSGDPAHSEAEAAALGYVRTVFNAQRDFHRKHNAYASSLAQLVGHVSFTRRMATTDRGDYTVKFHSTGKDYSLSLVPKQFDAMHRAFYLDDTGTIRAEDDKPATASSSPINRR